MDEFAGVDIAELEIDRRDNEVQDIDGTDNDGPVVTKLPRRCHVCQRIDR